MTSSFFNNMKCDGFRCNLGMLESGSWRSGFAECLVTGVHPGCKIHRVWLYPSRTATLGRIHLASNMHDPDVCFGGKRVKNHRSEHVLYFGELNTFSKWNRFVVLWWDHLWSRFQADAEASQDARGEFRSLTTSTEPNFWDVWVNSCKQQ